MKPGKLHLKEGGEMPSGNKQIFILDDDESVRRSLGVLLVTYGFTVDTFTSAGEFFRAVPNSVPGCLILDIHMPGLDGWKTLQHLFNSGSHRPVILISADRTEGLKEKALEAGAVGFLQKPFNDWALVELIKVAFKNKNK
jgi:FixJ family two-component response regulator